MEHFACAESAKQNTQVKSFIRSPETPKKDTKNSNWQSNTTNSLSRGRGGRQDTNEPPSLINPSGCGKFEASESTQTEN